MARFLWLWCVIAVAALWLPPAAHSADKGRKAFSAVVIYDPNANLKDNAFNEAASQGVRRAVRDLGVNVAEVQVPTSAEREAFFRKQAESGVSHIIAIGFQNVIPAVKIAEEYPEVNFTIIDGVAPPVYRNVRSIIFKDHQGAFLVGLIAAATSKTGTIGFVGGMDIPLIRNFAQGYIQGARYANPKVTVVQTMVGTTNEAWNNPDEGYRLATEQFIQGADVVFAAAGASGLGVLRAAAEKGKFAIGVDTNQNGLYPGTVLTSMIKKVDVAIYETLKHAANGYWTPGIKYFGLAEGALDYSVDQHNRRILSQPVLEKAERAKKEILRGEIEVNIYNPN